MRSRLLHWTVLVLCVLALLVSCSKDEFTVGELQVQPYVHLDGTMGLSLYATADIVKDPASVQMVVKDPSGNLSWSMTSSRATFNKVDYYGSSDISMPSGVGLPVGQWSVDFLYKDGSTVSRSFEVSYTDVQGALERNLSAVSSGSSRFDSQSNLTVIP